MNIVQNNDIKIGIVIMASGLGKRFGGNKLMAELSDKPVIQWILDTSDKLFDSRVVVTRSDEVKKLCESLDIDCILHELPDRNDTVRLGIEYMSDTVDYCFFVTGDQPLVSKESIVNLINEAKEDSENIVRLGYLNEVGSPVGFPKRYFEELLTLPKGKGGNWIVSQHENEVKVVQAKDRLELYDIDTREDLNNIKNMIKKNV